MAVADEGPHDECALANQGQDNLGSTLGPSALPHQPRQQSTGEAHELHVMMLITKSSSIRACATCIASQHLGLLIIKTHVVVFQL